MILVRFCKGFKPNCKVFSHNIGQLPPAVQGSFNCPPGQLKEPSRHTSPTYDLCQILKLVFLKLVLLVESASVKISVVKFVLKQDSSSLHYLTKQRDPGLSESDFIEFTPILLKQVKSEAQLPLQKM